MSGDDTETDLWTLGGVWVVLAGRVARFELETSTLLLKVGGT